MKKAAFCAMAFVLGLAFCSAAFAADEEWTPLPFPVKIGGHEPKIADKKATFAVIADAVANDAELEATVKDSTMIICNVVAVDEKGNPAQGASPVVIMLQNTNKTKLNKTLDGKPLAAGSYRIAVVADGKTSMVNFKIK